MESEIRKNEMKYHSNSNIVTEGADIGYGHGPEK